jgi:iron(III) transport system substrate-binding protein
MTVIGLLPFSLVACGGNSTASGGSGGSSDLNSMSVQALYKKAKSEGAVTVYTPLAADANAAIAKAFNQTYPGVKVNAVTLGTDDQVARVGTEQQGGKYAADVLTEDGVRINELLAADAVEPYTPQSMPDLPSNLTDAPKGYQSIAFVTTRAIVYNTKALKAKGLTAPTSLEDLTKPEWKGNFALSPNGVDLYVGLIAQLGAEKAKNLIDQLGANKPVIVTGNSQAVTNVSAGEPAAAISYGTYGSPAKKKNPGTIDFVNLNPLLTVPYFLALAKNAPDPAAARLFINWYGSQEGQNAVVAASGFTSVRDDVTNDPNVWDPSKWSPVYEPFQTEDEYNKEMADYQAALGVS